MKGQFSADIRKFVQKTNSRHAAVARGAIKGTLNSIRYGSPLTGSPGQPVGEGDLRDSWESEPRDARSALIFTTSPYALPNEDGIARPGGGPYILRSSEGGRWSVHKTRTNFHRIVTDVTLKIDAGSQQATRGNRK